MQTIANKIAGNWKKINTKTLFIAVSLSLGAYLITKYSHLSKIKSSIMGGKISCCTSNENGANEISHEDYPMKKKVP